MARRDYGSGSITPKGANRWKLRWYTGTDPITGERNRKAETFAGTKRDAMRRLSEVTASDRLDTATITLGETIGRWRAVAGHANGTARNYDLAVETLPAAFTGMQIGAIRAATISAVLDHVLVDARLWPDDTPDWVTTVEPRLVVKAPKVVITLTERTAS